MVEMKPVQVIHRRFFDPAKKTDLMELKFFIQHGRWQNSCPFYLEEPFLDIPAMCERKFAQHQLSKIK
jgi:hypothetical protein